jgi:antitoxin component HigA of HigAB toxin-antitoxin module
MDMRDIHPIRTEKDYVEALREVSIYSDNEPEPGSAEGDRFAKLMSLIEDYERRSIFPPSLLEAYAQETLTEERPTEDKLRWRALVITPIK